MKKMLKTVLTVSLMAVLALDMQGCASIQKKFTRKKKTETIGVGRYGRLGHYPAI